MMSVFSTSLRTLLLRARTRSTTFSRSISEFKSVEKFKVKNTYTERSKIFEDISEGSGRLKEYEVSTDEMKYVDRLMPALTVPACPEHTSYPTPSGWSPPKESALSLPYYVRRTKNHMLPVYQELHRNGRQTVIVGKIDGDIWALDKDLREYLQSLPNMENKKFLSQVHEVKRFIRVKGDNIYEIGDFLMNKGF